MRELTRQSKILVSTLTCLLALSLAQNVAAVPMHGLGAPLAHPDLAGGQVVDFEADANGAVATTFGYPDVSMTGNNVLRITHSFDGSFNVTGNSLALTTNDRTQEITFNFLSPVNTFGFNFGGADLVWRLIAYSAGGTILDEQTISPFGNANDGEWFGISGPGIASAKLYNTAFDIGSNTGTPDYVVIDNFTYVSAVPEPSTVILMGLGLAGLFLGRWQRRHHRN